jgi:hypothetical protein
VSTDTEPATADRQRARAFRRSESSRPGAGRTEPPRQRRPALAALALLLIVGGALAAGLLAVRMDERVAVIAAAREIPAGTEITEEDLKEVSVASEGVATISVDLAEQVVGSYARIAIPADGLVGEPMLTTEAPVAGDRAEVAIPLNPALTPSGITNGDKVQIVRIGNGQGEAGGASVLGEGLVLNVTDATSGDLGASSAGSLNLLVPADSAALVVDAAGSGLAGLAILQRGVSSDVELAGPDE